MAEYRVERSIFDFTEKCLREYFINLHELELRREYLTSSADCLSQERVDGNAEGCQLQKVIERLDEDEDIARYKRRTEPITMFLSSLSDVERRFVEMKYFKRMKWSQISDELGIAEITAKVRWKRRLVCRAAKFLLGRIV